MKHGKITPLSNRFIRYSENTPINEVIDNPNCTFLGHRACQPFTAFYVWEKFFVEYGERVERFIEFGCEKGNTSVYFLLQCLNHAVEYIGFDKNKKGVYKNTPVKRILKLANRIRVGNGYKRSDEIEELVKSKGMTVLFTDCVDKPWEFVSFAPMMKPGDVLAVHDWDRAIKDKWVTKEKRQFKPYKLLYEDERIGLSTLTRFFLKE